MENKTPFRLRIFLMLWVCKTFYNVVKFYYVWEEITIHLRIPFIHLSDICFQKSLFKNFRFIRCPKLAMNLKLIFFNFQIFCIESIDISCIFQNITKHLKEKKGEINQKYCSGGLEFFENSRLDNLIYKCKIFLIYNLTWLVHSKCRSAYIA